MFNIKILIIQFAVFAGAIGLIVKQHNTIVILKEKEILLQQERLINQSLIEQNNQLQIKNVKLINEVYYKAKNIKNQNFNLSDKNCINQDFLSKANSL